MKIAIVDDEITSQEIAERLIKKYPWKKEIVVDAYSSGEEFCEAGEYDVVFMDVEMSGMDGFEAARRCKEKNRDTMLVFLTTHTELSRRGYIVNAFRYVDKKNIDEELSEVLEAINDLCMKNHVLKFHMIRTGEIEVPIGDILYIETDKRNIVVHTSDNRLISNRKIDELEEELKDYGFFRCHKSYLVNLENIAQLGKTDVYFKNGEKAMVSVRRCSDLKQKHMEYKFRYANS